MVLSRSDLAKYPFLVDAAQEVKSLDLGIDNLENPELKPVLERAERRIEEALSRSPPQVSYRPREEGVEIPSFPIAVVFASASGSDYMRRRYALAEAKRAYELLKAEDKEKVLEIAKVFNWRVRSPHEAIGGRRFDCSLFFVDFLRNTRSLHEKEWKLVNRTISKGEVYLTKAEAARLLQEEIQRHIEKRLSSDVRSMLPDSILVRIDNLKKKYVRQAEAEFRAFPTTVVNEAFPPCISQLYEAAKSGRHISHVGRFTLTAFLVSIGMKLPGIIEVFKSSSDFNERMTRYQVEHIAGDRGSRTKYIPPTCETLRTHGLCPAMDELCRTVKHPLDYYRRKTRMLKKDVPVS